MSDDEDDGLPKLAFKAQHSLFVRNLSPQISESILREVFADCDTIEKVSFRAFPNSNSQFFAQIDFTTLKGVTEGSKLSGVPILGVACECGVVDPVISAKQLRLAQAAGDKLPEPGPARDLAELQRRIDEEKEDHRLRTVHVAGLPDGTDESMLRRFCKNFGDVERLRVDVDPSGRCFGLVEFKERGPAHISKTQRDFSVDGRVFVCTESKVLVNESEFMEQTIQIQDSVRDAMGMRQILAQQPDLKDKLDKVRAAALSFLSKDNKDKEAASPTAGAASSSAGPAAEAAAAAAAAASTEEGAEKKEKKQKKEKKDKKEKKAEKKKLKKQQKKEAKRLEKLQKKKKRKKKVTKKKRPAKPAAEDAADAEDGEESVVASVSESPDGPVDLESEVEMVDELCVLGTSSASSVSSTDSSQDEPQAVAPKASPRSGKAARKAVQLKLADLRGRWMVGGDPTGIWTVLEGGAALFNGRRVKPKWSLVEEDLAKAAAAAAESKPKSKKKAPPPPPPVAGIFCEGQRAAGWELDLRSSTANRLVWKKADVADTLWERQPEEPAAAPK